MAERAFAAKLEKVGFVDLRLSEHVPWGVDQAALFPLFTPEVVALMRELIPPDRQDRVAVSVIAKARKPT